MSDTTRGAEGDTADQHLTVEDAGTTTDPADLVDEDDDSASSGAASSTGADDSIGHVFDQTNGLADGLDGDSDGTAESDSLSRGERGLTDQTVADDEVRSDDDGVHDLRDANP